MSDSPNDLPKKEADLEEEADLGTDPPKLIVSVEKSEEPDIEVLDEESGEVDSKKSVEETGKRKKVSSFTEEIDAVLKRDAGLRLFYVILGAFLLGGGAIAVTYFLFPAAIATIVTLLGLTGPLALIVPLVAVGLIGALFGAELLAFLEERFAAGERSNHAFMRGLVITCGLIAGIALGVFIVASTPAVLGLLSFATAVPVIGVALPYVIGAAASLLVTGAIGYALYRASGMQKEQLVRDHQSEIKSLLKKFGINLTDQVQLNEASLRTRMSLIRELCLSKSHSVAQYEAGILAFDQLLTTTLSSVQEAADFIQQVKWERNFVRLCAQYSKTEPEALRESLLIELENGLDQECPVDALNFAAQLVQANESQPMYNQLKEKIVPTEISGTYTELFQYIQDGNKEGARAAIAQLKGPRPVPGTSPADLKRELQEVDVVVKSFDENALKEDSLKEADFFTSPVARGLGRRKSESSAPSFAIKDEADHHEKEGLGGSGHLKSLGGDDSTSSS